MKISAVVFCLSALFSQIFPADFQECQVTTTMMKPCGEVFPGNYQMGNSQISKGKKGPKGKYNLLLLILNYDVVVYSKFVHENFSTYVHISRQTIFYFADFYFIWIRIL